MKLFLVAIAVTSLAGFFLFRSMLQTQPISGAPPYQVVDDPPQTDDSTYSWLQDWVRPDGPARVGLQVGHWRITEVPDELQRLRGNTGSSGGGKSEWEVNLAIAEKTSVILREHGIETDILPATVPPSYWADVFIAIHADGSESPDSSGFKAATPRRDLTGRADDLLTSIESHYAQATGLEKDPGVTRNMRGYYAFGWWRYTHAVHPMTVPLILETGFLTSPQDREIIIGRSDDAARGLAEGIIAYLQSNKLI